MELVHASVVKNDLCNFAAGNHFGAAGMYFSVKRLTKQLASDQKIKSIAFWSVENVYSILRDIQVYSVAVTLICAFLPGK